MRTLASLALILAISNCTPAENARALFLNNFFSAIKTKNEVLYKKMLFKDPRADGKEAQLILKNKKLGDDQRLAFYAINRLEDDLKNQKIDAIHSKTDLEIKKGEAFSINENGPGEIKKAQYTPIVISFFNNKNQTFIELTLWQVSGSVSFPNEDTKGRGPKEPINELYVGDITLFEDVIDESN